MQNGASEPTYHSKPIRSPNRLILLHSAADIELAPSSVVAICSPVLQEASELWDKLIMAIGSPVNVARIATGILSCLPRSA